MEVTDIKDNDSMLDYADVCKTNIVRLFNDDLNKVDDLAHKKLICNSWLMGARHFVAYIISTILINCSENEGDISSIRSYLLENTTRDIELKTASVKLIKHYIDTHSCPKCKSH